MHDHRHDKPPSLNPAADRQAATTQERRVFWALLITGSFMVAEVVGGIVSGSLALLADAGHMLTDTGALALSWYALRVSRRPATPLHSYGQHRFQVLAALINGATLIGIAVWIAIEAARRVFAPVEILGGTMLVVALAGLVANIAAFAILHGGSRDNLNVRGAALHVLGDLLGSAAAIVAAVVILITGWAPVDPLLSVLVALLIVRSAWSLITKSWHVLMEGAPQGIDTGSLEKELVAGAPGVLGVHHVHLWSLTPERPLITLHANIGESTDHDAALHQLKHVLAERFGLSHATIQIERATCADERPGR